MNEVDARLKVRTQSHTHRHTVYYEADNYAKLNTGWYVPIIGNNSGKEQPIVCIGYMIKEVNSIPLHIKH